MGKKKTSMIPMPTSSGSVLPKLFTGLIVLGLLALVVKHPTEAASGAKALFDWLGSAVDRIASFFQQVAG